MPVLNVQDLLSKTQCSPDFLALFDEAEMTDLTYASSSKTLHITISTKETLMLEAALQLKQLLSELIPCAVDLDLRAKKNTLGTVEMNKYFNHFQKEHSLKQLSELFLTVKQNHVECLCPNDDVKIEAEACADDLNAFMRSYGIDTDFHFVTRQIELVNKSMPLPQAEEKPQVVVKENMDFKRPRKLKYEDYEKVTISQLKEEAEQIQFIGTVFDINTITTRKGTLIQTLMVHDDNDAATVKRFEGRYTSKEDIESIKKGDTCVFYGRMGYDNFAKEVTFTAEQVVKTEGKKKKQDLAAEKRVELHLHSNMSEMDGVCEVKDLISQAFDYGHKAVAITDHMVVQAFPQAQSACAACRKKDPERDFKVLYGVEMNMVDDHLTILRNPVDTKLDEAVYCVYDLETTGLSNRYDHTIEFGGVKVKGGEIIDTLQLFIKPPVPINSFIAEKTNITNAVVAHAPAINEVMDQILQFIGDSVLVAHNATFDYGFINAELARLGKAPLTNPVIDTLDLARAIHKDRRTYRLGNIARHYRVAYDEDVAHRADYDAKVLSDVFMLMLQDCKKRGAVTVRDLDSLQSEDAFVKVMKRHITVLAKNKAGLKRLFQLITTSHTDTLALFGKANSKNNGEEFMAEPRILRTELLKDRENLLFGTACYNGEIFEIAANRSQRELEEALSFYDYVEIQPLENYRPQVENHVVPSFDRLKEVLKNIIDTAKKLGKIVVATGDVHYSSPEQKILRDIYISTQGIGGVRHPLHIYDAERRKRTVHPDQHFRTTDEMLECFSWLSEEEAVELVVTNTNKIADLCEFIKPVHDKLYTPVIDGADEKLTEICYETAHRIYGNPLPEIVEARLKRELNSIIGNGFGVIYYISHLLVKKSNQDGYLVGSRGSVGSSFVATMSGITEVNPLAPHYVCKNCHYSEFITDGSVASGFNLQNKACPHCGTEMVPDGQDIPFETFLGFEGDKVPDIDLNFSGEYQPNAHAYTKEVFGEEYVYRAGTIGTVAQKTAFGYVSGYCEEKGIEDMRQAQRVHLSMGCEGVKRTTGQHPGGIIVIPNYMDVHDFTPVNYPANNPQSEWKTTHFDFHAIHDNVLKFDILGHVDPTVMRMFQNISGIDPKSIPMNDLDTMSLFSSSAALHADPKLFQEKTGAIGLPEFGTKFVRGILELTKPKTFSDLVIISGLSHGTDVWLNNAKDLVEKGIPLQNVIGCRDDIMTYLIHRGLKPKDAFFIMESVRKGKGLKPEWEEIMKPVVDEWYIDSCKKIKYMFPKAHAVAYVIMAIRIAWFKVYHPYWYYAVYFSLRCDAYEIDTMIKGYDAVAARMDEIHKKMADPELKREVTPKDSALITTFESCLEMYARGYKFSNIDIDLSDATAFKVMPNDKTTIIPPFTTVDGLGENVAKSIVEARNKCPFLSKEDILARTQLSGTLLKKLEKLGCLSHLQEENQMSLF